MTWRGRGATGEDDKTLKDIFSLEETPSIRSSADCCSTFRLLGFV